MLTFLQCVVYVFLHHVDTACIGSPESEVKMEVKAMWVPGVEPGSSERAAISPTP